MCRLAGWLLTKILHCVVVCPAVNWLTGMWVRVALDIYPRVVGCLCDSAGWCHCVGATWWRRSQGDVATHAGNCVDIGMLLLLGATCVF
jgi:hypothetical protein